MFYNGRQIVEVNFRSFDLKDAETAIVTTRESWHDDLLGPLFTSHAIRLEEAQVYLLDGTFMGTIDNLRKYSREKFKVPHDRPKKYRRRKHYRP